MKTPQRAGGGVASKRKGQRAVDQTRELAMETDRRQESYATFTDDRIAKLERTVKALTSRVADLEAIDFNGVDGGGG